MYINNLQNSGFDYLPFYGDQMLITGWWMYNVNDDLVEKSNNGSISDVYTNQI